MLSCTASLKDMRCYKRYELPRVDDFCILPKVGEMSLISGNQVVCATCFSTFDELVVILIFRDFKFAVRRNRMRGVLNKLEQLLPETFPDK